MNSIETAHGDADDDGLQARLTDHREQLNLSLHEPITLSREVQIQELRTADYRFPLPENYAQDAKNFGKFDYANPTCHLLTGEPDLEGVGTSFTLGEGNREVLAAIQYIGERVFRDGITLNEIFEDFGGFHRDMKRALGVSWCGAAGWYQMGMVAISNALIDLAAKVEEKSAAEFLGTLSPAQQIGLIDFHPISNLINEQEALGILRSVEIGKQERLEHAQSTGIQMYLTAGWSTCSDEELVRRCQEAESSGIEAVKIKVGHGADQDFARGQLVRNALPDIKIMVDSNQVPFYSTAVELAQKLAPLDIYWFEEPGDPDAISFHQDLRTEINQLGIRVATGEAITNGTIALQFERYGAWDIAQCDNARLTWGEHLALKIYAHKRTLTENLGEHGEPGGPTVFCNHAGGTCLNEVGHQISSFAHIIGLDDLTGVYLEYVDPFGFGDHFEPKIQARNGHYVLGDTPGLVNILPNAREKFLLK